VTDRSAAPAHPAPWLPVTSKWVVYEKATS
jgi:hypothetical protein